MRGLQIVKALRPLAQLNLAPWLLLGIWWSGQLPTMSRILLCAGFSLVLHITIVCANELCDQDTDTGDRTLVSGGSGLVSAIGTRRRVWFLLLFASSLALALLAMLFADGVQVAATLTPVMALCIFAYHSPPIRAGHSGGGGMLQALGTAVCLPVLGAALGNASIPTLPLTAMFMFGYAGHVATAYPDLDADRSTGKATIVTALGRYGSQLLCILLPLASTLLLVVAAASHRSEHAQQFFLGAGIAVAIATWLSYRLDSRGVLTALWLGASGWLILSSGALS